ncbi:MAG: isoprenyl transferase [Candidatus Omnitrophica bacterium]|nr:isoprenyl transferase [Candidatus Omnitrophota bacterium]
MNIPRHVGIIMDGNGRWATSRNLARVFGHNQGVKTVRIITESASKNAIEALTLFTFSTENWKRSEKEVSALMGLLLMQIREEGKTLLKNNVRFNYIGRIKAFPENLQNELESLKELTKNNTGLILTLALNYGGRQEIVDAVKKIAGSVAENKINADDINEQYFEKFLYTNDLPELDLVIRTSGEMRISNFLIWQSAYSEFYITKTLWPDFTSQEFEQAIQEYGNRKRRFGG